MFLKGRAERILIEVSLPQLMWMTRRRKVAELGLPEST